MAGKQDISEKVVQSVEGISKKDADQVVEVVFDAIARLLEEGETVRIPGFGSFSVVQRAARKGRNPATGESFTIRASKSIRFKASKDTGSTGPRRK